MYAKVLINGTLEIVTGLHIGTGGEYSAIGMADSPVLRDKITELPLLPGSSLKGKLRSLLAKKYNKGLEKPEEDDERIKRLFGAMKNPSRLIFSDMVIANMDVLNQMGIYTPTEIKFENTINRASGVANPRQIERTIRGCEYHLSIIYNVEKENEMTEDFNLLVEGFKMLQYDYLGGHGSRGYGKVRIRDLSLEEVVGEIEEKLLNQCQNKLKDVEKHET